MYISILVLFFGLGLWLINHGLEYHKFRWISGGLAMLVVTGSFFGLMSLWGEMLWYQALHFERRFWLFLGAQLGTMLLGAAIALLIGLVITWTFKDRNFRYLTVFAMTAFGVVWGAQSWTQVLIYFNRMATGMLDPVFNLDTGFFLFALPFYDQLYNLLMICAVITMGASWFTTATAEIAEQNLDQSASESSVLDRRVLPMLIGSGILALVFSLGQVLQAYHLVFSEFGVVQGAGWTDIHVRLPALLVMASIFVLFAVLLVIPWGRQLISHFSLFKFQRKPLLNGVLNTWAGLSVLWVMTIVVLPALIQWLIVIPNEISYEKPYIKRNIQFTLQGFDLDKVEQRQFPVGEHFTPTMVQDNQDLLSEVRLWDWRALDLVYKQFQEIRLYYEFDDVDIDRYTIGERYRQVMISARELAQGNLARQSQTFVNRRFKYTHGYGLAMATVSDFTEQGLPNLLVKDIPPKSSDPALEISQPQIYYGELTDEPVIVNSTEAEFDFPRGEMNEYIRYDGNGGVLLDSLWRKIIYSWKFDGARLLFSGYPKADSRIMFHRQVRERVKHIAPFLSFDEDPYIVLAKGKMYWMIDAYTTSKYFPYSEPFSSQELVQSRNHSDNSFGFMRPTVTGLQGVNYLRNSVKAVINAFDGSVQLYVFAPQDPLIQMWQKMLPGLFKPASDMPSELRRHVRYPEDFLLVQGLVYAKYHMQNPEVFYNQEDLWVRATEKHYDTVVPVDPYYVMWELPGSDQAEFVMIQPFTPKNRQVLIGWIAGLSDGDNYGRFLAYQFPKEKRILGPQQVETKIDQDAFLSGQLTLWDQRGSNVIRGNVLAIPIDDTLIYVEPIYLQAETAAYPELRLVVVMHNDKMSYAESFDEALSGLFKSEGLSNSSIQRLSAEELRLQLNETFEAYLKAIGSKQFDASAEHLKALNRLLGQKVLAK